MVDHPEAVIVAGGTDVGLWVTKQHRTLPVTVSLDAVVDLAAVVENRGHDPDRRRGNVSGRFAVAGKALSGSGGDDPAHRVPSDPQPRHGWGQHRQRLTDRGHAAGVAGAGRIPAAAAGRGAPGGETGRFFHRLPPHHPGCRRIHRTHRRAHPAAGDVFRCYKVSKRFDQDISAVCAAFLVRLEDGIVRDIRIGYGGMAATPIRPFAVEDALIGHPWNAARIRAAQVVMDGTFAPLSDMRASAAYRRTVARNLLLKCYLETSDEAAVTRLVPA